MLVQKGTTIDAPAQDLNEAIGKYRWTICGLIFFATTVNYLDRAVISLLKPYLATAFEWNAVQEAANYADIEIAFKISYAIGMLFAGRLLTNWEQKLVMRWQHFYGVLLL